MLAGAAPTQIGSPVMGAGYQTLNGYNAGVRYGNCRYTDKNHDGAG
jgi:hypothetical protein